MPYIVLTAKDCCVVYSRFIMLSFCWISVIFSKSSWLQSRTWSNGDFFCCRWSQFSLTLVKCHSRSFNITTVDAKSNLTLWMKAWFMKTKHNLTPTINSRHNRTGSCSGQVNIQVYTKGAFDNYRNIFPHARLMIVMVSFTSYNNKFYQFSVQPKAGTQSRGEFISNRSTRFKVKQCGNLNL